PNRRQPMKTETDASPASERQRMAARTDAGPCVCSAWQTPLSPFASNKVRRPQHGLLRVQTPEFRTVSEHVESQPQEIDSRGCGIDSNTATQ
ncbi:MAG: hypothetical protein KDD77_02865, partial [Caldilineaceae bacterium]|nr:hypothetical protein [Caldilineaceae bacterium]